MPTATERIPILVSKADKSRYTKKAKVFGFQSISEFARTAMDRFAATNEDDVALTALFKEVKAGTVRAERSLDQTIAFCDASNDRMQALDAWMREKGYR
jgi:hypothetical protein